MIDFTFMAAPLAACLIYPPIFTYFGLHVLKRGIVFVDLSLAQLAALGTTLAFVWHMEEGSPGALMLSLGFIFLGSAFFTYTRLLPSRVPQEAIIGIVYVVGSAAAILTVSHQSHGAEHIKDLLNGSILWVSWKGLAELTLAIMGISVFHWFFRDRFFELSAHFDSPDMNRRGLIVWEFLFYFTLGVVIALSVKTAGIYLIFTFLIVPAVCGLLFFESFRAQFILGSALGILTSLAGLFLSYFFDLPTGSAQVCSFGGVFLVALGINQWHKAGGNGRG